MHPGHSRPGTCWSSLFITMLVGPDRLSSVAQYGLRKTDRLIEAMVSVAPAGAGFFACPTTPGCASLARSYLLIAAPRLTSIMAQPLTLPHFAGSSIGSEQRNLETDAFYS